MLERLRKPFKRLIQPIAGWLVAMGVSANAVTVLGAVGTIVAALATGVSGQLFWGALAMTILVVFDSLDGSVAALSGGGTKFGAFLDSTLDRIADWAVLVSVILYYIIHGGMRLDQGALTYGPNLVGWLGIGAALYAIMTSFVTSYARARAESVGYEAKNGIATRSDRLVIILLGMAISGLSADGGWMAAFMLLLALLGTITVFQRIFEVRRQMKAERQD
ncbi:CDP-diacylglycerol--glycerol-3-phosphate 3-phosphatidyltransferase [Bifidobacterium aemilianum]|uniref:Phosphatidylinositol phosphate synthase n=1 Tax=Bifidobacterium aemilianum TaxID=2493120 RepID=A0A366K8S6_9BIFI|nr:CDP-alcohol phosphatidyltransferase family protein [Bifidobacterium aemilianum]RBP98069.1 CDP-diacylglycerol--glycerol-3-phosphate 3-phosphatidyltransferase [Bifidobacterium aemilianum]